MIINEKIYMSNLKRERTITIYVPDDYQYSGKRYPVMYINDGQNAFFDDQAYFGTSWGFLDYVYQRRLDVILVAISCNFDGGMREVEYGPWYTDRVITILETGKPEPAIGGEGEEYVTFLKDELKPYIDSRFPTNPEDTAIVGSSAGGNISAYAALKYPQVFKKCAALSCAFWYYPDQFEDLIRKADLSAIEYFYLDRGTNEGNDNEFISNLYKYDNDRMYDALAQKGLGNRLMYRVYEGAKHNEGEWRKRLPVFMEWFYHTRGDR